MPDFEDIVFPVLLDDRAVDAGGEFDILKVSKSKTRKLVLLC